MSLESENVQRAVNMGLEIVKLDWQIPKVAAEFLVEGSSSFCSI